MSSGRGLALRRIVGHCTVAGDGIHAWYRLAAQGWSFRPDSVREQLILEAADAYAQLGRRSVHIRVTTRPYPVSRWARAHNANAPAPLPGWREHLMTDQAHLARRSMADKEVYVGVQVPAARGIRRLLGGLAPAISDREVAGLEGAVRATDEIMALSGMGGRPVTPRELEWLLHRSCSLGLPAPITLGAVEADEWASEDLGEFTDHVQWSAIPFGRTIQVHGEVNGHEVVRHVCILSVGRMSDLEIPPGVPWMQRTDALPFPVEWSARVVIEDAARIGIGLRRSIQRIRAQKEHYELDHHEPAPGSLDRQAVKALAVEDELSRGLSGLSTRTTGWYRLAVAGDTEEEALERAGAVRKLYAPEVTITRPADQYALAREFIPGERLGNTAYRRRMPVTTLAAALPAATATVGDRIGIHLGETSGTSARVVTWEPWLATEQAEESGLAVICAGLGGGKSTAGGNIIYRTALQGVPWTVLDPSGRLTALCHLPKLRGVSKPVDLLDAQPGALSPYRVIVDPLREHFDTTSEWEHAQGIAATTRRLLASSVLRSILPRQMQDHVLTEVALMRAVGASNATNTACLNGVVTALQRIDGDVELTRHAGYMHDFLTEAARTAHGQLIFPAGYQADYGEHEALLTVYSLRGLSLPDEQAKGSEDLDERLSMCVLYIAAWLAQRGMYFGDVHARKGIFIDEAWALSTFTTGRRFIERAGRDSRKHNTRVIMASQNPSDLLRLDLANLISAAFIGRLTDEQAQRDALRFIPGAAPGQGYEPIFASLSRPTAEGHRGAREFIFSDGAGGVERMRMDLSAHPDLLEALNTTADPAKARNRIGHRLEALADVGGSTAGESGT